MKTALSSASITYDETEVYEKKSWEYVLKRTKQCYA